MKGNSLEYLLTVLGVKTFAIQRIIVAEFRCELFVKKGKKRNIVRSILSFRKCFDNKIEAFS